jgi:uncharacterized protein YhhL (DUF1145 family)
MFFIDLLGAGLTLVAIGFLGLGGYLAALRLLRDEAARDPLALAIATLLAATAEAVGVGLLLGGLGLLRISYALALQAGLVLILLLPLRKAPPPGGLGGPARTMLRRSWEIVKEHPALSLVLAHAAASQGLRGIFRPPLSWDSLMYHLLLTGTWLRDGNLFPVFGNIPNNYYGYVPANGSIWFWWWMAPSHSELWVNLASFPHWVLLGLAVGGVARELGARRYWPLAAFLVLLTPTVIRFAATQYVDIFMGSVLVAACFFGLRWLREPSWAATVLAGAGLGLAAGAKVLGVPYGAALAGMLILLGWGRWGRRVPQLAVALLVAALLGSYFYVRNIALGAGPLALSCEMTASGPANANVPTFPRMNSVLDRPQEMFGDEKLLHAFLGIYRPQSRELGVGPQSFLLLLAAVALPFFLGRERWREGLVVTVQIWFEILFWLAVPFAKSNHVFANIRYLIPAIGFAFAAGAALADRRGAQDRWMKAIALILGIQGLLQLHAEMPIPVRKVLGVIDVILVILALSPGLRAFTVRHRKAVAVSGLAAALLAAPLLARHRVADRGRALAQEYTAHTTSTRFFAAAWSWLDQHGGDGNVAAVSSPNNYFVYPAMGTYLSRDVRYVNINRENLPLAVAYPQCQPRVNPEPMAWVVNLANQRIRWVHLSRYPTFPYPAEDQWASAMPRAFVLRYEDDANRIYEFLPVADADAKR